MRFFLFVLSFICFTLPTLAQDTYQITYEKYSHQKKITDDNPIEVLANSTKTIIGTKNSFTLPRNYPNEIIFYSTLEPKNFYSIIELDSTTTLKTIDSTLFHKIEIKKLDDTKRILGMKAKHARAIINSNTIDIWYVDNMNIKAAPTPIGLNLGFVLEYSRNNNYTIKASRIENIKKVAPTAYYQQIFHLPHVDQLTYKDLVWKNKFQTIPLLKDQQINFDSNRGIIDKLTSLVCIAYYYVIQYVKYLFKTILGQSAFRDAFKDGFHSGKQYIKNEIAGD